MGDDAAVEVFFAAGYAYDDAVELGELWNVDFYQAKVLGGQALQDGEELPIEPLTRATRRRSEASCRA